MDTKDGRLARLLRNSLCVFVTTLASISLHAAPADGIVHWNPADKDAAVLLSNDDMDIEIAAGAGDAVGVRSNRPIYPGEGIYYLEIQHHYPDTHYFSFGIATSDALLQGLDVVDTATYTSYGAAYSAVGMIIDYRGEYPVTHFFAETGSGLELIRTRNLRDFNGPVYLYISTYRNLAAVSGQPQHTLSFGTLTPFTYDPDTAINSLFFDGEMNLEHGWPIDNEHPEITITSGNGVTVSGGSLNYSAFATDAESGNLSSTVNWFLDDLPVGTGSTVNLTPSVGNHIVRAEVLDGAGQPAFATARAQVLVNEAIDSDADGLSYYDEINAGTNPGSRDTDFDGLDDGDELSFGTDPLTSDSDSDGITDGYEIEHGLNPLVDDAASDLDSDTFDNATEFYAGRSASNADDYPGHGTVLLNSADAHTNIMLQADALSFSVAEGTGIGAVRSDIAIAPGSGWHYFEGQRHADIGNYGFGVATASASLTLAAGSDGQSVGVSTTGDVSFNGSVITTLTAPEDITTYGLAVDYAGPTPVVHIIARPAGGEYEIVGPITMTGVGGDLRIFAYGESQSGVIQQSVNAGQNKTDSPFEYSPRYLLYRNGLTSAEFMRNGWGTDYVYSAQTSVAYEDSVSMVRERMTSPYVAISRDGQDVSFVTNGIKSAVRANQAMIGEFRYWEASRFIDPTNIGVGFINPYAVIDEYCCVTEELSGAPPSMSLNSIGGIWRNLVYQAGYATSNTTYGFAVDYRGSRPTVYVILNSSVVHTMTLDDFITPIVPMLYGGQSPMAPVAGLGANFGTSPFQNDARQALIDAGVDVLEFIPGWGIHTQPLNLTNGPSGPPSISFTGATAGLVGQPMNISATAQDALGADLTAVIGWTNDQTADVGVGGSYNFTPATDGTYRVIASVTDAAGLEFIGALNVPVTFTDNTNPIITVPTPISIDLPSGSSAPVSDPAIAAFLSAASANDDVDGAIAVSNDAPPSLPAGTTIVEFSATDSSGNTGSATSSITVNDTGAPNLTLPTDTTVGVTSGTTLAATDPQITAFLDFAAANDDVDGNIGVSNDAPATFPLGDTTVTFSSTDAAGNTATASATVTVNDTGAPNVTAPANISIDLPSGSTISAADAAIAAFLAGATANDDVDGALSVTHDAPAIFAAGITSVTFSATDAAGNTGTASATVTINDTGIPTLTAPADIAVGISIGSTAPITDPAIVAFLSGATAADDVDGTLSVTHDAPAGFPVGPTVVTFSATDAAGNTATASATVTVNDTGIPTLTAPADIAVGISIGSTAPITDPAIVAFLSGATAADDVDGTLSVTHDAPAGFPVGPTVVTFNATDTAGNIATASATVTVNDTGAPVVTAPASIAVGISTGNTMAATDSAIAAFLNAAIAEDNVDGPVSVTHDAPVSFPIGATLVTFSATDVTGNTATASATVTVNDTGAPAVTVPADIILGVDTGSSVPATDPAIVDFLAAATAIDDVDGSLPVTNDAPAVFPVGLNAVTYTAVDAAGNATSVVAYVVVSDTGEPTVITPADLVINLTSGNSVAVSDPAMVAFLAAANAVDVVDGTLPVTHDAPETFPMGVTPVTFSATDTVGNTSFATATVTIIDAGLPIVTPPAAITINVIAGTGVPATDPAIAAFLSSASANDDVDGALAVTHDAPGAFAPGLTTVTFAATDSAGNVGSATSSVAVTVTNVAPTVSIEIQQGGQTITTATRDGGLVTLVATIVDPNIIDSHAYDWIGTDPTLVPQSGAISQTFVFDPSAISEGVYSLSITVTDDGSTPLTGSAMSLVRIIDTLPALSSTDDSDGDGIDDATEGAGDSDGDRIPDYLDPDSGSAEQLPAGEDGASLETSGGLVLRLGETAFTVDAADGLLTIEEIEAWATAIAGGTPTGMDDDYFYPSGIFSIEVTNMPAGGTALITIPLTDAIPANATWRQFTMASGWSRFLADADNLVQSAAGSPGACPLPGSAEYTDGLGEGHYCVQLRVIDGGANDSGGTADGTIRLLDGPAMFIGPEPDVQVQSVAMSAQTMRSNDGERVVLDFVVSADSDDAEVHEMTIGASGELNEATIVSSVALYHDANNDGTADSQERIATGTFSSDDGQVTFTLSSPHGLSAGDNRFLVTYNF